MDDTPKMWGFRTGYMGYEPGQRKVYPGPPFALKDPRRYEWIHGWADGRRLAKMHRVDFEAKVNQLRIEENALELEEESR